MPNDPDDLALQRCAMLGAFFSLGNVSPAAKGFFISFDDGETAERFLELRDKLFDTQEQRTRILRQAVKDFFIEDQAGPGVDLPPAKGRLRRALNALFGSSPEDQAYISDEIRNW